MMQEHLEKEDRLMRSFLRMPLASTDLIFIHLYVLYRILLHLSWLDI